MIMLSASPPGLRLLHKQTIGNQRGAAHSAPPIEHRGGLRSPGACGELKFLLTGGLPARRRKIMEQIRECLAEELAMPEKCPGVVL